MDLAFRKPQAQDDQQPLTLGDYYPHTLTIDGRRVTLHVTRFDLDQYNQFTKDFARVGRIAKRDAMLLDRHRQPLRDRITGEILNGPDNKPMFEDDETVLARIELDESPEDRVRREQRDADDERFANAFIVDAISTYVTLPARQLVLGNDESITTGAGLLKKYAARQDVLQAVLAAIYTENILTDEQKKMLESRRGSRPGSNPSTPQADGGEPAPTAPSALPSTSATPAPATVDQPTSTSGPMDPTS